MFRALDDFVTTWRHEAATTARVLSRVTDVSLEERLVPAQRSIGELAWHIVVSLRVILAKVGIEVPGPGKDDATPASAAQIHSVYVDVAHALVPAVERAWERADLAAAVDFYGAPTPRGQMLAVLLHHEIHHRGQLTALMRAADLPVPSVYGPTAEDAR